MTVDWTAISTISELVGAVVVVVTLWYVAVQIRQNTNAILANSRQTLLDADLGREIVAVIHGAGGRYVCHRACKAVLNFYTGSPEFARVLSDWLKAAKQKAA